MEMIIYYFKKLIINNIENWGIFFTMIMHYF
jgi:hypothetical protein